MIQDTSSSQTAPQAQSDELEFEPTLSADVARLTEDPVDSEDEGEQVRDEDLMLGDESYVSPDPFPPLRQSQPAPSGVSPSFYRETISGGYEAPRRAVPPPLVPPPLSTRLPEFPSRPPEFQSVSAPQSRVPALGDPTQESPVFGDRHGEPVTSVHRTMSSARPRDQFARNVEERAIYSQPLSRGTSDRLRIRQESALSRGGEPADYARSGGSDRPLLERRRVQRKDIVREGDVLLGKLRIERVVTEGLLVNAEAVHLGLGTRALVVLLSPHGRGFADAQEHFVRTARTVAQMQSEHVARITEIGTLESGAPFLVAEMQGHSDLGEVLRMRGAFAVSDAVDYAIQVAEALAEAHSLGVIHGSLRPSSLRMSEGMDGWPLIKVLGFGAMAHWSLSSASVRPMSHRAVSSALPYLSPEQIRSPGDLDTCTDIWSLGAILHEMLVGWSLYHADNTAALLAMIAADPPSPITTVRADVPRQLESVILRCLQKDKSTRFATVADLARALQPYAPPECQATVERIVRVMARGSTIPAAYSRPNSAMVHIRSHSPGPRSFENTAVPKQTSTFRLGIVVGAVVVMGAAAGVTGAVLASQMLRSSSSSGKTPETEKQAAIEPMKAPEAAATPVKNVAPIVASPPANSAAAVVVVNPAIPAVANPGPLQQAQRPVVAAPRRAPVLTTTAAPASHKEARADKPVTSSAANAADLFGDIK